MKVAFINWPSVFFWQLQPKMCGLAFRMYLPTLSESDEPVWPLLDLFSLRSCVTWMNCLREMSCQQPLIPAGLTVSTPACLSSDLLSAPTPASWITPCSTAALMVRHGCMSWFRLTSRERCERWKLQWIHSYGIKRRGERCICSLFIILSVSCSSKIKVVYCSVQTFILVYVRRAVFIINVLCCFIKAALINIFISTHD